jgi:hypothetical protein
MTVATTSGKDAALLVREIGIGTERQTQTQALDTLCSAMVKAPSRQQLQRKNRIKGRW